MARLPKKMLVDEFTYFEYEGIEQPYNEPKYAEPIKVDFVRIDRTVDYTRSGLNDTVKLDGVIITDSIHTTFKGNFLEKSKVVYDDKEHFIHKVIPITRPFNKRLLGYELEVV